MKEKDDKSSLFLNTDILAEDVLDKVFMCPGKTHILNNHEKLNLLMISTLNNHMLTSQDSSY